jgi:hypothetical protein
MNGHHFAYRGASSYRPARPEQPSPRPSPAVQPPAQHEPAAVGHSETERIHRMLFSDYRTAHTTPDFTLTDGRRTR